MSSVANWSRGNFDGIKLISRNKSLFLPGDKLIKEIYEIQARYSYSRQHIYTPGENLVLLGKESLIKMGNLLEEEIEIIYCDLSDTHVICGLGVILNGFMRDSVILPRPNMFPRPVPDPVREVPIRERASVAHIEAVAEMVAEQGRNQRGEYKDGWMAATATMCKNIGVKVPSGTGFKEIKSLDPQAILNNLKQKGVLR